MIYQRIKETAQHTIIYGLGGILTQAVGFFLIPIYTRYLGTDEYGLLELFNIFSAILLAFFGMGLYSALFRSYYDYDDEENRICVIITCFYFILFALFVVLPPSLIFAYKFSTCIFGDARYTAFFQIIVCTGTLGALNRIPLATFRARKESKKFASLSFLYFLVRIGLILYFVVWLQRSIFGVLMGSLIGTGFSTVISIAVIVKNLRFRFSLLELRKLLRFGLPIIPTDLTVIILTLADRFYLKHYASLTEVGLYSLGYRFGMIVSVLLFTPLSLILPAMIFSLEKKDYAREFYAKLLTYIVFLGAFISLGISNISQDVLKIIATRAFWEAYKVVPLICLSYVLFGCRGMLGVGMLLTRRTEYLSLTMVIGAVANLVLNFILIPKYSMMGAAVATVISSFVILISRYPISNRLYRLSFEWWRIIKIVCCATILYLVGLMIVIDLIWLSVVVKTLLSLSFPFVLLLTKFYYASEKQKIAQVWDGVCHRMSLTR